MDVGLKFTFTATNDFISHPSGLNIDLVRHNDLTWLPAPLSAPTLLATTSSLTRDLIHRRCGHLHESGLLKLDSLGILGVSGLSKLSPMSFCPDCATAKSTIAIINRRSTRDRDPLHPFHTLALDIWGPTSTPDFSGNRYVLGAVRYTTPSIFVVPLKFKSDTPFA